MTTQDPGRDRLAGRGDDIYAALMRAHERLGFAESAALNARLVLILANLAGDPDAVIAAIERARRPPA
ncbi:DUF2783 domain-containing protein [Inquilinus limosus]|uniref:DUF2783 domain-containing protein n=1 Tax=Inquilinus limosus TaxID=171674 RepID=UPI000429CA0E|nr:DUF2783 domain-containing protein [Inquilinus limosus]